MSYSVFGCGALLSTPALVLMITSLISSALFFFKKKK